MNKRLTNIMAVGRFQHKVTGKSVNVHKGKDKEGWTYYFYLLRQKRHLIAESELRNQWEKIGPIA
jgi:hypothetical protein